MFSSLLSKGPHVPDQPLADLYYYATVYTVHKLATLCGAGPILRNMAVEGPDVPDQLLADLLSVLHHPLVVHLLPRLRDVGILQSQDIFIFCDF